jgi:hypothetical protein
MCSLCSVCSVGANEESHVVCDIVCELRTHVFPPPSSHAPMHGHACVGQPLHTSLSSIKKTPSRVV